MWGQSDTYKLVSLLGNSYRMMVNQNGGGYVCLCLSVSLLRNSREWAHTAMGLTSLKSAGSAEDPVQS